jgi:hypothetical protein
MEAALLADGGVPSTPAKSAHAIIDSFKKQRKRMNLDHTPIMRNRVRWLYLWQNN